MEIFSSCFPRLVQDALDLPVCRAFVVTATILPGVNPLEPDVPPSHAVVQVLLSLSRRLTACHGHSRSRFTSLLTLCLHYPKVCKVKGLKTQDSMEWIFRTFGLSFIPTRSNHPRRFSSEVSPLLRFSLQRMMPDA